jgi:hypothetical protein
MELGRHLDLGVLAKGTSNYTGAHRDLEGWTAINPSKGIYGVAVGNRANKSGYGMSTIEERDSDPNIRRV